MPTENRSSNTEQMVSVPRSAVDLALKLIARNLETVAIDSAKRRNEKAGLAFRSALLAQPAAQHQGDAVGWTYEDGKEYTACQDHALDLRAEGIELAPVYRHPPTSDGFSAGDIADQGAKAFRDGQRALVLPDRELYTKYLPGVIPSNAAEVNGYKDGWNACLEEVSRLNAAATQE